MLVSDLACRDMENSSRSMLQWLVGAFRRCVRRPAALPDHGGARSDGEGPLVTTAPIPLPVTIDPATDVRFRWRKHPYLLIQDTAVSSPLDLDDPGRGARAATTRGLFLARSSRFDEAREAFTVAARETSIDLTAIPGFWDLPRGGMLAAAEAYERAGRIREAASLSAQIRLKYRPRMVAEPRADRRSQSR